MGHPLLLFHPGWGWSGPTNEKTVQIELIYTVFVLAERTRFELVVRNNPYVGLANRWFQPLTHLSGSFRFRIRACKYRIFLPNYKK